MSRLCVVVGMAALMLPLGESATEESIQTSVYPFAIDTSVNATPCAVFVVISDWEEMASQSANIRVTRAGSGSHFKIWSDSTWVSASLYSSCPLVTLDSTGGWAGWICLRTEGVSSTDFKAYARKADTTLPQIEEEGSHSVTLLDGTSNSGWLEGHIYTDSSFTAGLEGIAVVAIDSEQRLAGVYLSEANRVDEGYLGEPGYFKVSSPSGMIESLEFRSGQNEQVEGYTISTAPWIITSASTRSVDDSSMTVLVSIPDTFGMSTDTLSIPVNVDSATALGICAVELSLSFDGEIVGFVGIDTSNTLVRDAGWLVEHNLVDDTLRLAMAGSSDLSGSGPLVNLIFSVVEEATVGSSTSLHFEDLLLNESGMGPDGYAEDGSLMVTSGWGDVSGDGAVHAYDAALLLKWIVDPVGQSLKPHQLIVADADLDGEITAYDGSLILQWIVGNIKELPHPGLRLTSASLRVDDFEGYPGQTLSVPILTEESCDLYSVEATACYDPMVLELLSIESTRPGHFFSHEVEEGTLRFVYAGSECGSDDGPLALLSFRVATHAVKGCILSLEALRINNLPRETINQSAHFRLLNSAGISTEFYLDQNYPNPFADETTISFGIMKRCQVSLKIYDVSGELVKVLADGLYGPAYFRYSWDGTDESGRLLGSGVYFCRMKAGKYSLTRKVSLIR